MAQTIADVENDILAEKANHPELNGLDSTSTVAIWRLLVSVFAAIVVLFQQVMDLFKIDIQAVVDSNDYGTDPWWQQKILAFQFGDVLSFINNRFQYAVVDATKQIIAYVAISSVGGRVQIKAATSNNGTPAVLNTGQFNALLAYCQQIRPSGIKFTLISLAADTLKLNLNVYYNAQANIAVLQPAVEAAINSYLATLYTARFDGGITIDGLINAVQAVPGVAGPQCEVLSTWAKNGADPYVQFTAGYQPKSGYFEIDPAYPLSATINYIAV
jgi:hypothetical protein